jgi:anti-sigma B factor antagonist
VPDVPAGGSPLVIERVQDARTVVLVLRGEIDLASAPQLENAAIEAVTATGPSRIVIDLAGVEFMDSTGLATLIKAQSQARSNNRSLILRHVPPQAQRVLEISGFAEAFVTE